MPALHDIANKQTPLAGTLAATTTAAAIGDSRACQGVLLQGDPDNTVDVLVGDAASQVIALAAGQVIAVGAGNVALLYAKTASGTATLNWLALV